MFKILILFLFSYNSFAQDVSSPILVEAEEISFDYYKDAKTLYFSEKKIQQSSSEDALEFLSSQPSFQKVQNGSRGSLSKLLFRGRDTLLIIDGVKQDDPSEISRGFDWSYLSLDSIESIEVITGAESLIYGPDAINGVVLVNTKKSKSRQLNYLFGSNNYNSVGYYTGKILDKDFLSISADYQSEEGISSFTDNTTPNLEEDGYTAINLKGKYIKQFKSSSLEIGLRSLHSNTQADQVGLDDPNFKNKNTLYSTSVNWEKLGLLNQNIRLNYKNIKRESLNDVDPQSSNTDNSLFKSQTFSIDYKLTKRVNSKSRATLGVGFLYDDVDIDSTFNAFQTLIKEKDFSNSYALGNYEYKNQENIFSIGFRYNYYENETTNISYKIFYLKPFSSFEVWAKQARGFKSPSLYQLYVANFGNPDLQTEKSQTYELGASTKQIHSTRLLYFYNEYSNLIQFTTKYINSKSAYSNGVELGQDYSLKNHKFYFSYSYLESYDQALNSKFLRVPLNKYALSYNTEFKSNKINYEYSYVDSRLDIGSIKLTPYALSDISWSRSLSNSLKIKVSVNNLFNKKYSVIDGYSTLGRNYILKLTKEL